VRFTCNLRNCYCPTQPIDYSGQTILPGQHGRPSEAAVCQEFAGLMGEAPAIVNEAGNADSIHLGDVLGLA
jgi:hypothetical protein